MFVLLFLAGGCEGVEFASSPVFAVWAMAVAGWATVPDAEAVGPAVETCAWAGVTGACTGGAGTDAAAAGAARFRCLLGCAGV